MIYFYYREIQFKETNLIVTDRDTTLMNVAATVFPKNNRITLSVSYY